MAKKKTKATKAKRRKPHTYARPGEMEERIELIAKLLARGLYLSDIKRVCKEKWNLSGNYVHKTYVPLAQKLLRERLTRGEIELQTDAMAFYEHVIRDPNESTDHKLKARKQLDKLLGLARPVRVDITTGGKEVKGYIGIDLDKV